MPTQDYIDNENSPQREPVELYEIWQDSTYWRHTSGDSPITYDSNTYTPAAIERSSVSYSNDLSAPEVSVTFSEINSAVSEYVANNIVEPSWIRILKLFRDQDPYETQLIFLGQILSVDIKGIKVQAICRGISYLLQEPLLQEWYQPECNNVLFDSNCGLNSSGYSITTTITLSSDEKTLTSSDFSSVSNNYLRLGYVLFNDSKRLIISHVGNNVIIERPFSDLEDGDTVTAYWGCDGDVDTCKNKFNNLENFFGFPFIPLDNPATWIGKES